MIGAGNETRGAVDDLAQAVGAAMREASGELRRVDELLEHAVAELTSAFKGVSDEVSRRQLRLARSSAAADADAAERLREVAEQIARDVNRAVTALQFRDVVGQKLGHVRRELEALERMMQRIREASAGPAPATGRAQLAARVQDLLQELEQAKAASPAQQEWMHAGEVELF